MHSLEIFLLGYASDVAGAVTGSAKAPVLLQQSSAMTVLAEKGIKTVWEKIISPEKNTGEKRDVVVSLCNTLAHETARLTEAEKFFLVLGGDHTSAIGSWRGAASVLQTRGQAFGLIWVDAHMDSHTPATTRTGNIHGMPLACLLGAGDPALTGNVPTLLPENVCLIGVRSYEPGEAELLKRLGVKIFFMDEIEKRGLSAVFHDARKIVTQATGAFGISLDIDSIDPQDAPGTGVPESNGIRAQEMLSALEFFAGDRLLVGMEIAEFDPDRDVQGITEKLVPELIAAVTAGNIPV